VTVERVRSSILLANQREKALESGMVVPLDATEAEMNGKLKAITQDRFVDRVFPTHYPSNEKLYYPGFEVLILKNPAQAVVRDRRRTSIAGRCPLGRCHSVRE
jgi:hypothetical protein